MKRLFIVLLALVLAGCIRYSIHDTCGPERQEAETPSCHKAAV